MRSNNSVDILSAVKKVRGGVAVSHNKNTAYIPVERMPVPDRVVLPMQQHIGAPCIPTVKVGDIVDVGQVIGDSDKFVSAPIHATVSGTVKSVSDIKLPNGVITKTVEIESDGEMRISPDVKPPVVTDKASFIKAIRDSGLVGLGGAGFPTHVKLNVPEDKHIDTLIINAAECEPYITVDSRECIENAQNILAGISLVKNYLDIKNVVIAIEDNKPESIKSLSSVEGYDFSRNSDIRIMKLESRYPQGAEKMMVQSATGRKVPPGKLPADVGCIVMNVASIAFIARYIETGRPLISRSITVDGSAINTPKNVRVPIGTNIGTIIDYCGGLKESSYKILLGGPMMGPAMLDTSLPISKQNNAILAFEKNPLLVKKERDCIRCGRCAQVCPMGLMPTLIERFAKVKDADRLNKIGINVCMECGSCAYTCPAGKPLVQYMRLAKTVVKEANKK